MHSSMPCRLRSHLAVVAILCAALSIAAPVHAADTLITHHEDTKDAKFTKPI